MQRFTHLALVALLGLNVSCSRSSSSSSAARGMDATAVPTYTAYDSDAAAEKAIARLSPPVRALIDDSFAERYQAFAAKKKKPPAISIPDDRTRPPLIPNFALPLRYTSIYDGAESTYLVKAPKLPERSQAVVLLLGKEDSFRATFEGDSPDTWFVYIPSRKSMNYQLVAEGDFWGTWDSVKEHYPHVANLPVFVVGDTEASEVAVLFANHYRWKFSGLAFSGRPLRTEVENLDHLPVVFFGNETSATDVWGGRGFVRRLQERGNSSAMSLVGGLPEALKFLRKAGPRRPELAPYTYSDNQYRRAWPWLEVATRKAEDEPVHLKAEVLKDELVLDAPNVTSVELIRSTRLGFPAQVTKVRLNDTVYDLPDGNTRVRVGEALATEQWKRKASTPTTLQNFFRNERVLLVYEDQTGDPSYNAATLALAEQLAHLRFSGLPSKIEVELPTIPLSSYRPEDLPHHRVILIGKPNSVLPIVSKERDYLPLYPETDGWRLNGRKIHLPASSYSDLAFSLIYPPEEESSIELALLLVASDEMGIKMLMRDLKPATALYRTIDFRVWSRKASGYHLSMEHTFDSYWGSSQQKSLAFSLPPQGRRAWEAFIQDIVVNNAQTPAVVLSPLIQRMQSPPTEFNYHSLARFLPDRRFAVVTTMGSSTAPLMNKLLDHTLHAWTVGVDDLLVDNRFDKRQMRKQMRQVLVDATALEKLNPEELRILDARLYPYSLHEIVLREFQEDPIAFGKSLLRTSHHINEIALIEE